jgi:hypothetical protein
MKDLTAGDDRKSAPNPRTHRVPDHPGLAPRTGHLLASNRLEGVMSRHYSLSLALALAIPLFVGAPPRLFAQTDPLYVMIPADTGYKITRVEKGQAKDVTSTEYVKAYGYRGDEMLAIEASKLLTFKALEEKPTSANLPDARVLEYVTGPDRQIFFQDGSAYFITVEFEKDKRPSFVLNEITGSPPKATKFPLPPEIRDPLMTPVPNGLAVHSGQGNNHIAFFSFKEKKPPALIDAKAAKGEPVPPWRALYLPEQGLWQVRRDGSFQQLTDASMSPLAAKAERQKLQPAGFVKKVVASHFDGKPVALLGLVEQETNDTITRLVYYDLKANKALKIKDLGFPATTFAVPDKGDAVYLVTSSEPAIAEYNPQTEMLKTIFSLDKGVNLRDVRICPLSSR